MLEGKSPFRLTTRFRGWNRVLALGLGISLALNFCLAYGQIQMARNLATPRIVVRSPSGIVLPLAASAFVWTPEIAGEYLKLFLPVLYTFTPLGSPPHETWSPFIHPDLLKAAEERFRKNQFRIEAEGLSQSLFIRETVYDPDTETAKVTSELRLVNRSGQIFRTPLNLTVELGTVSDPLNPYGHAITAIH